MKKNKKRKPLLPELTIEERDILLPILIQALKLKTNDMKHIKGRELVDWFRLKKDAIGYKRAFNNQRLMKLINYIRAYGLTALCASNDGYWITRDEDEIEWMIESFEGRVESQLAAIKGLRGILVEIRLEREIGLFEML